MRSNLIPMLTALAIACGESAHTDDDAGASDAGWSECDHIDACHDLGGDCAVGYGYGAICGGVKMGAFACGSGADAIQGFASEDGWSSICERDGALHDCDAAARAANDHCSDLMATP